MCWLSPAAPPRWRQDSERSPFRTSGPRRRATARAVGPDGRPDGPCASIVGLLLPALDEGSTGSVIAGLTCRRALPPCLAADCVGRPRHSRRQAQVAPASAARCWCSACCWCTACPKGLRSARPTPRTPRASAYSSFWPSPCRTSRRARALQSPWKQPASVAPGDSGPPSQPAFPSPSARYWPTPSCEQIESLLPFSFAFAAGAMLALVLAELAPQTFRRDTLPPHWPAPPPERR